MRIENISRVFDKDKCKSGIAPDSYQYKKDNRPSSDFVLCRDKEGKPTAIYGKDKWDYNPYRLSANSLNKFRFDLLLKGEFKAERRALVDEAKYLLFCIQYYAKAGHTGTVSVSTLNGYYKVFRNAVQYCISLNTNQFLGIITLQELFSNELYLKNFLTIRDGGSFKKRTRAICEHLTYIGQEKVGFKAVSNLKVKTDESKQTPIIPTRIYLALIKYLTDEVEQLYGKLDRLPDFLSEFSDRFYGRAHERQKSLAVGGESQWRPNMQQALETYGLTDVFKGELKATDVNSLSGALKSIQYRMRLVLHLYTGMRNQEVMRIPYDGLGKEDITEEFVNEEGETIVEKRVVKLISTTTKFTGYREAASWYAAPEAEKAMKILRLISGGLAKIYGVNPKNCDLFLNPIAVKELNKSPSVVNFGNYLRQPSWMQELVITEKDYAELQASDPTRDFQEEEFQVGNMWSITSHQFRRSLAYYAASSGFVKLPTLKRQFKHLTLAMTRYYSRNFENAESIFGFYNPKTKEFELPNYHTMADCQSATTTNVVDMLMEDMLGSTEKLYGKTGGYVERQREKLRDGEVLIEGVRKDTRKRIDKGEINYRDTLLGGCMKMGKCDSAMLGAITACLACDEGTIKKHKVDIQIEQLTVHITYFEEGDGEHQVMSAELDELIKYKKHRMGTEDSEEALA